MRILLLALVLLLPLAAYLFYPLQSDEFKIVENAKLLETKAAYLGREVPQLSDTMRRPNVLWIMADDLGYYDTDLYSAEGYVETPNIRRIAEGGVKFTNAYVTSPLCSPSRASVLTGRYNQRFGFEHQLHDRYLRNRMEYYGFKYIIDSRPWDPQYKTEVPSADFMEQMGLPRSEVTAAEIFRKHGYRTGLTGKWHVTKSQDNAPTDFGFDEFYGFYSSHSLYSPEGTDGIVDVHNDKDWTDDYIWSGQRNGRQAIQRNGKIITEERYLTTAITDESIAFVESAGKDQPFFLFASYNAPHTPFQAPSAYMEKYSDEEDIVKQVYYAMIKCLDDEIGRLLDHLEAKGLLEHTIIGFVSDNGGAAYTFATDNQGLKGGKITNFEGGVKVPMIMSGPGLPGDTEYNFPTSATDLLVTTLAMTDIDLPSDRIYDGADLTTFVQQGEPAHDYIYFRKGYNYGIRSLDHKMTWNSWTQRDTLLFELGIDPYERQNKFQSSREITQALMAAYESWDQQMMVPQWPSVIHFNFTDGDGTIYPFEN
ncbi:MAG: sulfatase-like hydrolase/transferase [Bacteroidota bacterium]